MTLRQYYRLLLCLIGFEAHGQRVSLSLATDTISIGKDIVLTCRVHGIQAIDRKTTRQWSMGDDDTLLCYNGRINYPKKYEENVLLGNEFRLTIFNVTESDLNIVYQCRYGFDAASKLIEAGESKLCYLPMHESTIFSYIVEKQKGTVNISVYFKRVFPLPKCSLNIDDSHFGIADFSANKMAMEVNRSLSLQKNVTCYHSFNIPCRIAGTPYYVGNVKMKDECPFKGKIDTKSNLLFTLIPIACIVMLGLVTVYFIVKGLVSRKRKHTGKGEDLSSKEHVLIKDTL